MSTTFQAKLRLSVWCLMPSEPPGTVPGQDERDRDCAAVLIYDAMKWIGNPAMMAEIMAGKREPMWRRLSNSIKRTGECR